MIHLAIFFRVASLALEQSFATTLVQVMAWYHQVTSHYLNQCWPRFMSPYDITRPQWVNYSLWQAEWSLSHNELTHWGRVMHICIGKITITGSDNYLNQCLSIVNWTLGNKLQWNVNRNSNIFVQENAFENVVCEMTSILSWPECVNDSPWQAEGSAELSHSFIMNPSGAESRIFHYNHVNTMLLMPWLLVSPSN